jgi:translation initiation factor 2 alpha subunit (eIF-2alpha)
MENEELMKKTDEFNEFLLKQAALTFSAEGVSRDLKNFIQKKIVHNRNNFENLTGIITAITQSDSKVLKNKLFEKDSQISGLLEHIIKEIKITDVALSIVMQNMLSKEALLNSEKIQKG